MTDTPRNAPRRPRIPRKPAPGETPVARVAVGSSQRVPRTRRVEDGRRPRKEPRNRTPETPRETPPAAPENSPASLKLPFRVGLLVFAFLMFIIGIGSPLHTWWKQNREYNAVASRLEQAKQENQRLESELAKWKTDSFIASQARSRLGYIYPGETQYLVVDPPRVQENPVDPTKTKGPERPWYLVITESAKAASEAKLEAPTQPAETEKK